MEFVILFLLSMHTNNEGQEHNKINDFWELFHDYYDLTLSILLSQMNQLVPSESVETQLQRVVPVKLTINCATRSLNVSTSIPQVSTN